MDNLLEVLGHYGFMQETNRTLY